MEVELFDENENIPVVDSEGSGSTGMIVRTGASAPVREYADDYVAIAADPNVDIDKLRAIIEMKKDLQARAAKQEYAKHFAEMQAEFSAVKRGKEGYGYNYAPIESLQKAYGPVISRHGFSYRWREETIETGKRTIMTISGYGHEEETYFDVPVYEGTSQMNPIQVAGAMSTYGRRYTFIAGFGVVIEDEDSDGVITPAQAQRYAELLNKIDAETDGLALYAALKDILANLGEDHDDEGIRVVKAHYTKRKKELGI